MIGPTISAKARAPLRAASPGEQVTAFKPTTPTTFTLKPFDLRVTGNIANVPDEVKKIAAITAATESLRATSPRPRHGYSTANARPSNCRQSSPIIPEQARFEDDFWKVWNHRIEDIEKPPAEATNKEQYELDRHISSAVPRSDQGVFSGPVQANRPADSGR